MATTSAGILLYKNSSSGLEVLLVHPGGPFWARKDAWGIPKGVCEGEDFLAAARREFKEELGSEPPEKEAIDLGEARLSGGKRFVCFAIAGDFAEKTIKSNTTTLEWPPRSGRQIEVPEVDKAQWFAAAEAPAKMHKGQAVFIERLADKLGVELAQAEDQQVSLF